MRFVKLEKAEEEAEKAVRELKSNRSNSIEDAVAVARCRAAEEWDDSHGAELARATEILHTAREARIAAEEALGLSGKNAPYPLGTELMEWKSSSYGFRSNPHRLTGRRGVVEAITRESQHPATKKYDRASIGEFVIRIVKKDGSKSKDYGKFDKWKAVWLPPGQEPKK